MAQAAAQRVGYANSGPVEAPADDDTVYPTTAPKWDELSPEAAMMGASVGYARGGTVQSNDINHRAALLAGLRKRYDAMIAMAQGALAHRDENAAVRFAQRAHDMVPDGKSLILHVQPDGNVLAIVHDPRGGEQSRHVMTPDQFHHYLIGPATSFDHVIENGVGHNLGIASGRPTPRVPEHPADPIHKVRQVLHHTRKMFGVDKIGQTPPRVGYAAGGPVRGYDDGGEVDDTLPPDPPWTNQDERDNPPPPYVPADNSIDDYMLNAQRGMASAPAQSIRKEPVTSESGMGELLARSATEKWNRNLANAPQSASVPGAVSDAWGSIKQGLADYINGTNAASPAELTQAKQNEADQNPGLSTPEVVQNIIAGPPDPNVSQLPTAEAPAETTAPSTATTDPQKAADALSEPPNWMEHAGYAPASQAGGKQQNAPVQTGYGGPQQRLIPNDPAMGSRASESGTRLLRPDEIKDAMSTFIGQIHDDHGYLGNGLNLERDKKGGGYTLTDSAGNKYPVDKNGNIVGGNMPKVWVGTGAAQGRPAATGYGQDQGMLPRNPSKEDLRPAGRNINGVPVNRNGEIIKPDGTLEFTPPNQSQRTVIDPRTGERLEMTGGTGIPIRPREGTPGGTGVRGALNRPFGLSAKDNAYQILSASGALDIVPSDKYGRSPEAQASEGARPWTQDMARRAAAGEGPMPRGAPPMYVTERPAPYYDPNTGQVVTPPRQVMPQSGPPVGVAPGSPEAGKPPAWQPPPNIPGAVGQQPPADDQSPAARAARAFPMASQTRQRVQYQGTLERQGQEDQLKREGFATRDTPADRMARERLKQDGADSRNWNNNQQKQYATETRKVMGDNTLFQRAYDTLAREAGGAAAELLKDYRAKILNDPNYKPSDEETGAMVRAHDLMNKGQNTAPPTPQPGPAAPIQPSGVPATQPSPQSVLRVPQPAQNLAPAPQPRQPAPAAIQALKADPRRRTEFDNYYGPGASARYLGQ